MTDDELIAAFYGGTTTTLLTVEDYVRLGFSEDEGKERLRIATAMWDANLAGLRRVAEAVADRMRQDRYDNG